MCVSSFLHCQDVDLSFSSFINILDTEKQIEGVDNLYTSEIEAVPRQAFELLAPVPRKNLPWSILIKNFAKGLHSVNLRANYLYDRYVATRRVFKSDTTINMIPLTSQEGFEDYLERVQFLRPHSPLAENLETGLQHNVNEIPQGARTKSPFKGDPGKFQRPALEEELPIQLPKQKQHSLFIYIPVVKTSPILGKHHAVSDLAPKTENLDKQENTILKKKTFKLDLSKKSSFRFRIKSRHKLTYTQSITENDKGYLEKITEAINSAFTKPDHDDGSLAPLFLRLAWHCCSTYDATSNTGGSNGATMRFFPAIADEAHYGLELARTALEPIKQHFPRITYSDIWTLAGKLAIEKMGGPNIGWKCGRVDCKNSKATPPNGSAPFTYRSASHVRETFERMGFNAQETVALLGCHGLGRCHKRISGFDGKWTLQPGEFSNDYFRVLMAEKWTLGVVPETGKSQYYNSDKSLMMLNTDMELIEDPEFRIWVEKYANDKDLYFKDFALVFAKLLELGVPRNKYGEVHSI